MSMYDVKNIYPPKQMSNPPPTSDKPSEVEGMCNSLDGACEALHQKIGEVVSRCNGILSADEPDKMCPEEQQSCVPLVARLSKVLATINVATTRLDSLSRRIAL